MLNLNLMLVNDQNKLEKWTRKWLLVFKNKYFDNFKPKNVFLGGIFSNSLVLSLIKLLNRKLSPAGLWLSS